MKLLTFVIIIQGQINDKPINYKQKKICNKEATKLRYRAKSVNQNNKWMKKIF